MARTRTRAASGVLIAAVLCAACGGGGSGSNPSVPSPPSPSPPAPPPPTGPNRAPIVSTANPNPAASEGHAFSYDATQGGTTFSDPDGDVLTYETGWEDDRAAPGLTWSDTQIVGTPTETGTYPAWISAFDGRGAAVNNVFYVIVAPNAAPTVIRPNADQLIAVGTHVDHDVTQGGSTFKDSEGDAITYQVSLLASPHGLSAAGTRVNGVFDSVGLVVVKVTATDELGDSAEDEFLIAAPASEPGRPALPATTYTYDDAELELPYRFRLSRELEGPPFWDTTPADNPTTNAGATLGRVLFYDKRVSITNTHACGSCHHQQHGFAAAERFSVGVLGLPIKRNAMALANVRYNLFAYFWDTRATPLESLVVIPIQEPMELGNPLPLLVAKLAATDFYPPLFEAAFGTAEINSERIAKALAQFLRSLISYQSKFDRAHHAMNEGEVIDPATVLTPQELRGEELLIHGLCGHCHFNDVHTGHPANNGLDLAFTDPGAGLGVFRPASLRNIARSAPYMHDGRFATLREVIDHYDHGVQDTPDLARLLRVQLYGEPRRLNLSEEDKDALEAFLNTLTDEQFLSDPKFSDPF